MSKTSIKIATVLIVGLLFPPITTATSVLDLYANAKNATVFIATYDSRGDLLGRGSGFFIDEGIVITNRHVIEGAATYYRVFILGDDGMIDPACVKELGRSDIKLNLGDDVAYIRVYVECPHGSLYFAHSDPEVGDTIEVLGYPALGEDFFSSFNLINTYGTVLDKSSRGMIKDELVGPWFQINGKIHSGNSGGPVIKDGFAVGVAVAAHTDENGKPIDGLFVPASVIMTGLAYANTSTFGYLPQHLQKNPVYKNVVYKGSEKKEEKITETDPFNPIPSNGHIAISADCYKSLGKNAEATGYLKQQGDGCRCISSYHKEGNVCKPGAPEYMKNRKKIQKLESPKPSSIKENRPHTDRRSGDRKSGVKNTQSVSSKQLQGIWKLVKIEAYNPETKTFEDHTMADVQPGPPQYLFFQNDQACGSQSLPKGRCGDAPFEPFSIKRNIITIGKDSGEITLKGGKLILLVLPDKAIKITLKKMKKKSKR